MLITPFLIISRNVNKYKSEFPNLYKEFEDARRKCRNKNREYPIPFRYSTINASPEASKEYIQMVEKYLKVKKFPSNNRKVVITTHNGGKFVGFYEDETWKYTTGSGDILNVDAHVIKWEKNYF